MATPIQYFANTFSDVKFEDIDAAIKWEQREAPRSEAYYATQPIPYTYGKGAGERTYTPHPAPVGVIDDQNWDSALGEVWKMACPNHELLFCNRYADQHQHLGWHADDSPAIDVHRPIVVVTFGAEREIWFKVNPTPDSEDVVEKLVLEHGSVLVMKAGMQQTHLHRIPKHHRPCGARISLTFRGLTPGFEFFNDAH